MSMDVAKPVGVTFTPTDRPDKLNPARKLLMLLILVLVPGFVACATVPMKWCSTVDAFPIRDSISRPLLDCPMKLSQMRLSDVLSSGSDEAHWPAAMYSF